MKNLKEPTRKEALEFVKKFNQHHQKMRDFKEQCENHVREIVKLHTSANTYGMLSTQHRSGVVVRVGVHNESAETYAWLLVEFVEWFGKGNVDTDEYTTDSGKIYFNYEIFFKN